MGKRSRKARRNKQRHIEQQKLELDRVIILGNPKSSNLVFVTLFEEEPKPTNNRFQDEWEGWIG